MVCKKHEDFDDFFSRKITNNTLHYHSYQRIMELMSYLGITQLAFTDGVVAWFGYARPTYAFF